MSEERLRAIAAELRNAGSVLFITGAGLSADAGLPTYRGIGGLYAEGDTEEGVPIEVALSGAMFARKPHVSWRHIAAIERACRGARPSAGHLAIAEVERKIPRTWVLTQNVDGLHRAAGSKQVIEIHGSVEKLLCPKCGERRAVKDYAGLEIPPRCRRCGAIERPEVVLFGEALPDRALALYDREMQLGFDLVFSVGTTSLFPYIAAPVRQARREGVPTVEINPGDSEVSGIVTHRLRERAAEVLPRIVSTAFGR